jgi:hypothetical protein
MALNAWASSALLATAGVVETLRNFRIWKELYFRPGDSQQESNDRQNFHPTVKGPIFPVSGNRNKRRRLDHRRFYPFSS